MGERIRARYFSKWPGAVLFFIPEGERLTVQGLEAPFGKAEITRACDNVQVSEGEPGRWTQSVIIARKSARAERGQQHRQQEATAASILRGSVDPRQRDRAQAIADKQAVDARVRQLKQEVLAAKSHAATTGQYMAPSSFRSLERQLEEAKQKSQALQTLLGNIRAAEKAENKTQNARFERAFIAAARALLDPEDLTVLFERARRDMQEEEPEQDPAQAEQEA